MKYVLTPFCLILTAGAALAHADGTFHLNPHTSDPAWLPVIAGVLAVAGAATLAWHRK